MSNNEAIKIKPNLDQPTITYSQHKRNDSKSPESLSQRKEDIMIHRNGMTSQRSLGSLNTGRKLSELSSFRKVGMGELDAGIYPEAHLTIQD
jgi:hypothetical protein